MVLRTIDGVAHPRWFRRTHGARSGAEEAQPCTVSGAVYTATMVAGAARSPLALAGLISFAISILMLAVPMFSLQVYDRVLGSGSQDTLLALVLITAFALAALGLLETVRTSVLARLSTRLGARLSPTLLAAGAQAGDPGQGLRDLTQLRQTLSGPALTAIFDAPWLPIALALVWLLHPELGYFGLASALLLAVLAVMGDLVARRRLKDANALTPRAQRQVEALGRQREVVTAMGLLPNLQTRFAQAARPGPGAAAARLRAGRHGVGRGAVGAPDDPGRRDGAGCASGAQGRADLAAA